MLMMAEPNDEDGKAEGIIHSNDTTRHETRNAATMNIETMNEGVHSNSPSPVTISSYCSYSIY
jgi:hypothetical protein